jgi:hypothetical protein
MKKIKTAMKVVFYMAVVTVLVTTAISCSKEPDYADKIIEDTLIAINENDYDGFIKHFAEQAKLDYTIVDFVKNNNEILTANGSYVAGTKKFWMTDKEDSLINVYYRARFSKHVDVVITAGFQEIEGEMFLVSFSLTGL